jgi:hypothetical protein
MRVSLLSRLLFSAAICALAVVTALAEVTTKEAAKFLPERVGDFRAQGAVQPPLKTDELLLKHPGVLSVAARSYASPGGEKFQVTLFKTNSELEAYAILTGAVNERGAAVAGRFTWHDEPGAAAFADGNEFLAFFKGSHAVVILRTAAGQAGQTDGFQSALAQKIADSLEDGSGDIPVLVKHLPDWETAQQRAFYALTQPAFKEIVANQPIVDAVPFDGGTEVVVSTYDRMRLAIVEYATPQAAFDADAQIKARIAQLRGEGKTAPSAYRRVGNYAVLVFDAAGEQAAAELINKVKYEKDVRWLGENPYAVERANRAWLNMSTSVIVNTVKATGLAIVICLTIGGVFGGWIFMRRRAQAALTEKFSDAGGMLRLNIDEMSAQNNAARLLGQGDK